MEQLSDYLIIGEDANNRIVQVADALDTLASFYRRDGDKAEERLCSMLGFLADTLHAVTSSAIAPARFPKN